MSILIKCERCGATTTAGKQHTIGWTKWFIAENPGDWPVEAHDICCGCIASVRSFLSVGEPAPAPTPVMSCEELRASIGHTMAEMRNMSSQNPLHRVMEKHLGILLLEQQNRIAQRVYTPAPMKS